MRDEARVFVGLGANLGDRAAQLRTAIRVLAAEPEVRAGAVSPVYESKAHTLGSGEPQPPYLNAVAELRTTLEPDLLLALFERIERSAGRDRSGDAARWAARPLDLDLLLYDDRVIRTEALAVPHPRLAERRFVLHPLADLAPDLVVPVLDAPVRQLLEDCPDAGSIRRTAHRLAPSLADTEPLLPEALRYVAVEGVIGAGKTSLARLLAERTGARLVLEEFEENPFLPDFYRDAVRWAFHTQLAFLASRFRQQKALGAGDLFHHATVADYTFDKDRIFAHITLSGDELQLYETLYGLMETATPQPDLVVYLQSSVDRLMENIAQRGRDYEKDMDRDYIAELSGAYDQYFKHYTRGPLLIIDGTTMDFVNDPDDFERLVRQIAAMAGRPGTVRFNPVAEGQLDLL
ncbi:MAG: 2-amino-4-hydroxy-6-hydroxymethyldihydropteridine diphosphokinase [Bacteroidota bacterium]